uniref:PQQ-dependent sugar dehydrogenase n=1 Tax=Sphingomonas nostoxanthinifaciens TaxID=2872652 RepID=UPI001CC1C951|nr:PQQ-dependent sugar dehydrogenase [Sphingomonas nostoxanthinifaciens]
MPRSTRSAALFPAALLLVAAPAVAQMNAGNSQPNPDKPFVVTPIVALDHPWALAFISDGRMLVTEKTGHIQLVDPKGGKVEVSGVPAVKYEGQGGLLFVATAPTYARDHGVYITYSEPGEEGSGLALAHATLTIGQGTAKLDKLKVIWRQLPRGKGGQFGAYVAFAPDGKSLFLASGERMRFTPAQDPDQAIGKILHLTLDGKPWPGNPMAGKQGSQTINMIDPPKNSITAPDAPVHKVTLPGPNLTPAETWSSGHRNPYGLAFDAAGHLWEVEHGPRGGDELNLILPGKNYGWPVVSYGRNYDGPEIANPDTHPEFEKPKLYWNPVIAPGGLTFYYAGLFPQWKGSAFIGGLASKALVRVAFDGTNAREAERWDMGARIRFVTTGPDGALWLLTDGERGGQGGLERLTPKS